MKTAAEYAAQAQRFAERAGVDYVRLLADCDRAHCDGANTALSLQRRADFANLVEAKHNACKAAQAARFARASDLGRKSWCIVAMRCAERAAWCAGYVCA